MTQFVSSDVVNQELESFSHLFTDDTVLDYIFAMADEWCETGEGSNEQLTEMILPFLESYLGHDDSSTVCDKIADRLKEGGIAKAPSSVNKPPPIPRVPQQKFTPTLHDEASSSTTSTLTTTASDLSNLNIENDIEKNITVGEKTNIGRKEERDDNEGVEDTTTPPKAFDDDIDSEQLAALEDLDDFGSAWAECRASGRKWGGRGFGGRGVNRMYQCMTEATKDVYVDGVTLAYQGKELLQRTVLRITSGRKYALLGMNGVGKSTLLRRIAAGMIPGFPPHLNIAYLSQEHKASPPDNVRTALQAVIAKSTNNMRAKLELEAEELEEAMTKEENGDGGGGGGGGDPSSQNGFENLEQIVERLSEIQGQLDELDGPEIEVEATRFLKGLGFNKKRLETPEAELSGGWRMRIEIAATLLQKADILLLDEPTNHLDLHGILWLEATLKEMENVSILLVSHDRFFVSNVATDIIMFENQSLRYFPGDYESFLEAESNTEARKLQLLDARTRQEEKMRQSAEALKQKASKGKGSDKELKAAKQRLAKVERIGLYRDDGKKFKLQSMSKMDESALRLPSRIEVSQFKQNKETSFKFPAGEVSRMSNTEPLLSLDEAVIGYNPEDPVLLNVTAQLNLKSRVAVVGPNGAGKTTLLKLLNDSSLILGGKVNRHPNLKVAIVAQNHVDVLKPHLRISATQLIVETFKCSDLDARSALGKFGLSGKYALQPMGTLSGGQKVRVSLAMVTWHHPHVLLLDEPTNHMDVAALQALANAVSGFDGAIVVVSHNRAFVASVCQDLWIVDNKKIDIQLGSEDTSFSDLFSDYCEGVLSSDRSGRGSIRAAAQKASARAEKNLKSSGGSKKRGGSGAGGAGASRTALM